MVPLCNTSPSMKEGTQMQLRVTCMGVTMFVTVAKKQHRRY